MTNGSESRPPLSLGQLGPGDDPLLLPITPGSSIEEIARLVRESGASRVELLVPDNVEALRSPDAARALRDAAVASGVRLTIFTADDRIALAAAQANLDVFGVGARVEAPRQPVPRAAAPALPIPPSTPETAPAAGGSRPAEPEEPTAAYELSGDEAQPAEHDLPAPAEPFDLATMPGAAADEADFLSRLDAFDYSVDTDADTRAPSDDPPRLGRSSEGALLFDAPGDLGVPRPAEQPPASQVDPQPHAPEQAGPPPVEQASAVEPLPAEEPKPSMLGALFGFLPARAAAGAAPAAGAAGRSSTTERSTTGPARRAPKQALSARLAGSAGAPQPRVVPAAQPRTAPAAVAEPRARRFHPAWLLVPLVLLGGAVLVWAAGIDFRDVANNVAPAVAPAVEIVPPARSTEAIQVPDTLVPLVGEPIGSADAAVQGIVLSAPVTVALEGTASTTTLIPFSAASGTLLFSNQSSQPITIPAGTPTQAEGLEFTFDETVTVPGAVSDFAGTRFGQASARLTARLPGAQGNIPAGTITEVPGYTGGAGPLALRHEQPFAGGSDAEVVVLTPDDVSRLLPEALSRLYARGVQDIEAALAQTPGYALVQTEATAPISPTQQMLADVQLGDFEVFPAIGQVVSPELNGVFKLSMAQQFEALASPVDQPVDEQLRRAVAALQNRAGGDVTPEEVQITGWRRGDGGLHVEALITPRAGYETVPPERAEQIAQSLRNLPVVQARAELDRLQSEGLIGEYRLPDDWQTVPDSVVVRIAPPAAPSAQP